MLPVSTISTLERTTYSILYEMPHGKPDPNGGNARLLQSAQKGADCWYKTFNFLRNRQHNPHSEERRIELLCSQRRKELITYDETFPVSIAELYSEPTMSLLKMVTIESAQSLLKSPLSAFFVLSDKLDGRLNFTPFLQEFVRQNSHDNIHSFLVCKRAEKAIEVNLKFLRHFSSTIDDIVKLEEWQKMDVRQRSAFLETYVLQFSAKLYNLTQSPWKPLDGIDKLINELTEKGPLMVLGCFGVSAYTDQPYEQEELFGRKIYAWRHGAARREAISGHSILLVGARKTEDRAYVYFIDPIDPSDPNNRHSQRIFKMSFTNLTSHIADLDGKKFATSTNGYAYHGNFNLNQS